jgi:death on curing protein
MSDQVDFSLENMLQRLELLLTEEIDFSATDTVTTVAKAQLLTVAAVYVNSLAVSEFGGRVGILRGPGLVEQVIGAAFQTYEGYDPHPGAFDKAAMLLRGITQGHPFSDGNKRTGIVIAAFFLRQLGYPLPARLPVDEVVELCLNVSAGTIRDVETIATALRRWWCAPKPM